MAQKRALRARVLALRDAMPAPTRAAAGAAITRMLLGHPRYRAAASVCAYSSFGSEFDTAPFIEQVLSSGRQLLLPRVDAGRRELVFHRVSDPDAELRAGVWGIREPDAARCAAEDPAEAAFMLVPGLAFTPRCDRLGYGGGFYDRVLSRLPAHTFRLAAAFALQICQSLPAGPRDQGVDAVLTETALYPAQN